MPPPSKTEEKRAVVRSPATMNRGSEIEVAQRERLAAVGRVAATIAHDLGTPLNSVLGYTQLLMQGETDDDRREKLTIIESQVRRMIETIQHVLDRTRGHEVPREKVDIASVVEDVRETFSAAANALRISFDTEIANDVPTIEADAIAIRQILINLAKNAIEATPADGRVAITVRREDTHGGRAVVVLEVADTGSGVPEDERSLVFEPLYTTKESQGGTGLGLAIVQWLAREHDGTVSVDGDHSGGAIFRVRLPVA